MKLWRVLTPGSYQIKQGQDTNFDDQIDGPGAILFQDFDYKGDFVDFTLPSDKPFVIDIQQVSAASSPSPQLDLGLSEDLFRIENGQYVATVSNLGSLDYAGGSATLELVADSTTESVAIPALSAPGIPGSTGLDAQTWTHNFGLTPALPETLSLRIVQPAEEITQENNSVTKNFVVPEPGVSTGFAAGLAMLLALARRRR